MGIKRKIILVVLAFVALDASSQEILKRASELFLWKDFREVIALLGPVVENDSLAIDEAVLLGMSYQGLQDYSGALMIYNKPQLAEEKGVAYNRAECYELLGASATARDIYMKLLGRDSTDLHSLINLARIDYRNRNYLSADSLYRKLVDINPENYIFRKHLGICSYQLNKEFDALDNLRHAWRLNKNDLELPVNIANVYARFREPALALAVLNEGLAVDSTDITILKTAAFIQFRLENYDTASSIFGKAFLYGDSAVFTRKHLGISYFNLNNYQDAIPHLRSFYEADTTNSEASYYLGLALCSWHGKNEGIEMLERTIKLMSPDTTFLGSLYAEIGQTWSDINNYERSLENYSMALHMDPDRPAYLLEMARLNDRIGNMKKSTTHYRRAMDVYARYIELQEAEVSRVMEERGLDREQVSSPGISFARQRISAIKDELFFLGEK